MDCGLQLPSVSTPLTPLASAKPVNMSVVAADEDDVRVIASAPEAFAVVAQMPPTMSLPTVHEVKKHSHVLPAVSVALIDGVEIGVGSFNANTTKSESPE